MKAIVVGLLELRRIARNKTSLFFILLFPSLIILIIGVAIFGASGAAGEQETLGVLDEGSGALGDELIDALEKEELLRVHAYDDLEAVQKDIRRETLDAAIVLPRGYTEDLKAGRPAGVQFLAPTIDPAPVIRSLVAEALGAQGARVRAAVFATQTGKGSFDVNLKRAEEAAAAPQNEIAVSSQTIGREDPTDRIFSGFTYPAASNLILFVFISSLAASGTLVDARLLGIPQRMLSTPTSARAVLAGLTLGRFVIAAVQGFLIFVIGAVFFGVDWGDPLGAAALIAVFVLVGTGLGMLAGTFFRTPEQAGSVGPPVGIAFGMLGGCMWPLEIVPSWMRTAGHATPHAWAMDAWIDLIGKGEPISGIAPQLGVLAAFAVVLLPLGAWRLRRSLTG